MIPSIKATNMTLTPAITEYVHKKLDSLSKFWKGDPDSVKVDVELGQISRHHKEGDIFRCEIIATMPHAQMRAVTQEADLYAAIDVAKDELKRQLAGDKDRRETLFRRGSAMLKRLLRSTEE